MCLLFALLIIVLLGASLLNVPGSEFCDLQSAAAKQSYTFGNLQSSTLSRSVTASNLVCTQLLGSSPPASSWKPLSNSLTHALNGNRSDSGRGLRLVAWNSGSAYLHNRTTEIEALLPVHKPHMLVISEAKFTVIVMKFLSVSPSMNLFNRKH